MIETEFKTLMHGGVYVNVHLLSKGIYISDKPFIYPKNHTMEKMIKGAKDIQDKMGHHLVSERYFDNLNKCQLVTIIIQINHD